MTQVANTFVLGPRQLALVEALESGKYQQYRSALRHVVDGYCCLGVACDIYDATEVDGTGWSSRDNEDNDPEVRYLGESAYLPMSVMEWFGFRDHAGNSLNLGLMDSLIEMNDDGVSFIEIAKVLRSHPHLYFKESR